jgi:uncharacterized protein YndB with AHSA1/START domain
VESGAIQREMYIDASPDVVFEVISQPEHVAQWFSDEASFEPVPGATGRLVFIDRGRGARTYELTVVELRPPSRYAFRWNHPANEVATELNSLLVTFELAASGDGTLLTMTETGYRDRDWDAAERDWHHRDHNRGWDIFLPNLGPYAATLRGRS